MRLLREFRSLRTRETWWIPFQPGAVGEGRLLPADPRAISGPHAALEFCDIGKDAVVCLGQNDDGTLALRLLQIDQIGNAGARLRIKRKPKGPCIVLLSDRSPNHPFLGVVSQRSES